MAEGIDVYQLYQTVTSWAQVKASGRSFVYIKVSDGTSTRSSGTYIPDAKAAGLKVGGYHYAQFGDPVAQANLLATQIETRGATDLAPALDLEAPFVPDQTAINFAIGFLNQIKARGHVPLLYASNSMLTTILGPVKAAVPDVKVWVARYGASPSVPHDIWQYSSTGAVPGITGSVDLDTGTAPLDTTPAPVGKDDQVILQIPITVLPDYTFRTTVMIECGTNSQVVSDAWVSWGSTWGATHFTFNTMDALGNNISGGSWTGDCANNTRNYFKIPNAPSIFTIEGNVLNSGAVPAVSIITKAK